MKLVLPLVIVFALASPFVAIGAQQNASQGQTAASSTAADGVNVYGQTLHPEMVGFAHSAYKWNDLKSLLPELLPEANQFSLSATEACKRIEEINNKYLIAVEESTMQLIYKMEFAVNAGAVNPPADLAVTDRLASPNPAALNELVKLMPEEKEQIMLAKALTLRSLAMIMLRDAALQNCPAYAQEKGLGPIAEHFGPN